MTADNYRTLMSLAEQGVLKSIIDSVLPFAQIVEAHRRVDGGDQSRRLRRYVDQRVVCVRYPPGV